MQDFGQIAGAGVEAGSERSNALDNGAGVVVRGGGNLTRRQFAVGGQAGDVGEGSTDVGCDA